MKLYAPITKLDHEQRMVFGYASTEALDSQGEIVRREAIEAALPHYMRFGNIREMHQPSAVGVAKEADVDEKGLYLVAKVVDEEAWQKVREGVYKGFSIGGRVIARDPTNRRIVTELELSEISLVDRPANPETVIDLYKSGAGAAAARDRLRKSMAILARFAGILEDIEQLRAAAAAEADEEGDGSLIPDRIADWLGAGIVLYRDVADEELSEHAGGADDDTLAAMALGLMTRPPRGPRTPGMLAKRLRAFADGREPLLVLAHAVEKLGARNSTADLARIQQVHDTAVELGAACVGSDPDEEAGEEGKAVRPGDLAKLAGERDAALAKVAALATGMTTLSTRVEEQGALLAKLAEQPAVPKYVLATRAIEKRLDGLEDDGDELPKTALDAIRKAHRRPIRFDEI